MAAGADFLALDAWIRTALMALGPVERRQLFRRIARDLVARNRARMAAQVGPDGQPWRPRARDHFGRVRKAGRMMVGLRAARRLKATATDTGAEVGWTGAIARIAAVHQEGALDYVDRRANQAQARYPARPLIGFAAEDLEAVRATILDHLSSHLNP